MFQRNRVDLDWSTLFNVKNEKDFIIRHIASHGVDTYDARSLQCFMMENLLEVSDDLAIACEIAALKFCIEDTTFALDVLSEEQFEKVVEVYSRKQFNSKVLKNLLSIFLDFW